MAVDHLLGDDPGLEDPWAFVLTAAIILAVATVLFATVVRPSLAPRRAPLVLAIWPFSASRSSGSASRSP